MNRRTLENFVSLCLGTSSQIFIQLVSVPLFLHFWNFEIYSIWLIANNFAQISSTLDLGTITAIQNRLAYLYQSKQYSQIITRQLSVFYLFTFNNILVLLLFAALGTFFNFGAPIVLILILLLSNYVQSLFGLLEAALRIENRVSLGLNLSNLSKFLDFVFTLIGIHLFVSNLMQIAILILILKVTFFVLCTFKLRKLIFFPNNERLSRTHFYESLKEGFPFFMAKFADTITLSGSVFILQAHLSAEMLVLFLTSRTFFRFPLQLSNLFNFTIYYELSNAWSRKDPNSFNIWAKRILISTSLIILLIIPIEFIFGPTLFSSWTHGKLSLSSALLISGVLYGAILILSQSQRITFNASNSNLVTAIVQFVISLLIVAVLLISDSLRQLPQIFIFFFFIELLGLIVIWKYSQNWLIETESN